MQAGQLSRAQSTMQRVLGQEKMGNPVNCTARTHGGTAQHVKTLWSTMYCTFVHFSMLRCIAGHHNAFWSLSLHYLQQFTVHCSAFSELSSKLQSMEEEHRWQRSAYRDRIMSDNLGIRHRFRTMQSGLPARAPIICQMRKSALEKVELSDKTSFGVEFGFVRDGNKVRMRLLFTFQFVSHRNLLIESIRGISP